MCASSSKQSEIYIPKKEEELTKLKKQQGVSVGIVLPTLNEEKTIGKILDTWKPLMDRHLIDEIIVIDSGSSDKTREEVEQRNIPFYDAEKAFRSMAIHKIGGKGENMWLGLFNTNSDILVIVDSDIEDPKEETIVNLVSPIIEDDDIMLSKSIFYRATQNVKSDNLVGGRVTRLSVKPIMQILFPELNNVLQPLNGNIAIRRSVLEKMPVARQYDADLDILLHVACKHGPNSIAQVNCGSFKQEGQTLDALERMAHQCVRLLFAVAHDTQRISTQNDIPHHFVQHLVGNEGIKEELHPYNAGKLPPAIEIMEYHSKKTGEIQFLRHSLTKDNLEHRFQGKKQAPIDIEYLPKYLKETKEELEAKPDVIVCSSLIRTHQTAQAILAHKRWKDIPIVTVQSLDERDWGELQGKTREEARWKYPEIDEKVDDLYFSPQGAESIAEVKDRATEGIKKIKKLYSGKKILCITHAGVLLSLNLRPGDKIKLNALAPED